MRTGGPARVWPHAWSPERVLGGARGAPAARAPGWQRRRGPAQRQACRGDARPERARPDGRRSGEGDRGVRRCADAARRDRGGDPRERARAQHHQEEPRDRPVRPDEPARRGLPLRLARPDRRAARGGVRLRAASISDRLARVDIIKRSSGHTAQLVGKVLTFKKQIETTSKKLAKQQKARQQALADRAARKAAIRSGIAARQNRLSSLDREIKQIIAERAAAERAAERARAAAARAAAAAAAAQPAQDDRSEERRGG